MKNSTTQGLTRGGALIALAFLSLSVASCATAPESPQGSIDARSRLSTLQNNPDLADRAPVELREAEAAVRIAEKPLAEADAALGQHRVYMADRKVAIAEARAATRFAEHQRARIGEERDAARLQSRTREVDRARKATTQARNAKDAAQKSKEELAVAASLQAEEYQRQIDVLQAKVTDRGVVLTLGDVLFSTGSAELQTGAESNLNKLVNFLNKYPDRSVQIEGHTDNVGSAGYNKDLSLRRAYSVRDYLAQNGIEPQRLSVAGIGMARPASPNETAMGRQQNRRVEIIVENPS